MNILKQRITSPFGERTHPITNQKHFHTGVDIVNDNNENVYVGIAGNVRRSRKGSFGEGNYIQIVCYLNGITFYSNYFHNKKNLVVEGQNVYKNDVIALQGNTGNSTGIHTHFEIFIMEWTASSIITKDILFHIKHKHIGQRIFLDPIDFDKFFKNDL